ncbi:MAG: hypothetical protein EXS18_05650 [Verrucomicrobiae bacterium]|nr:hypothetical protein [Verrucomicrobiae bacterium]
MNQKTSGFLKADGEYMPFHWEGFSVYSDGFAARGRASSPFSELRADQIRAELYLRGVFHRAWQIDNLELQRLQVTLGRGTSATGLAVESERPAPDKAATLDLRKAVIQDANLNWGEAGKSAGSLQKVRVSVVPEGNAWLINGSGGKLRQTGLPDLATGHLKLRYQHPQLFVTDVQFKLDETGTVDLSGELNFDKPSRLDLLAKFNNITVTPFLPEDWRARLHGNLVGSAKVTGLLDTPESIMVKGSLSLVSGRLEALPVLERIAVFTRTDQFRQFALQRASADFSWVNSTLNVTQLILESEGLIRIEGNFLMEQRVLDGQFQVGVTAASLRWLPGSKSKVFTTERGGYLWAPMRVTGPVDRLREDLSPRLAAAAESEVIEGVKGAVEKGAKELLDLLLPPAP